MDILECPEWNVNWLIAKRFTDKQIFKAETWENNYACKMHILQKCQDDKVNNYLLRNSW